MARPRKLMANPVGSIVADTAPIGRHRASKRGRWNKPAATLGVTQQYAVPRTGKVQDMNVAYVNALIQGEHLPAGTNPRHILALFNAIGGQFTT
jgi:hypothetical protein